MTEVAASAPPPPTVTPAQTEKAPKKAKASDTVIIGCRLPSGITLEVGLQTLEKNADGKYFTMVKRLDNYERIVLKGWHHHNTTGLQMPAGVSMNKPFLNRNVSRAAWDEWTRTHSKSWLLKNKVLFAANTEAEAQLMALEAVDGTPKVLAPIGLTKEGKPLIDGKPAKDVETADFVKERQG
jgi:hypothetical protein